MHGIAKLEWLGELVVHDGCSGWRICTGTLPVGWYVCMCVRMYYSKRSEGKESHENLAPSISQGCGVCERKLLSAKY